MHTISEFPLQADQAALWFIGQSGFVLRAGETTVVIDPYLGDSVSKTVPELTRRYPPPIQPDELKADLFIVTHSHLDHLDPETIVPYRFKEETIFISPRLAAKKLLSLGIAPENLVVVDSGISQAVGDVLVEGVYALPNDPEVIDTAGYKLSFANGRSVYHSSDTAFSDVLLAAVPRAEVALVCINGKSGNLDPSEAARIVVKVQPKYALPHHHDMFDFNAENPRTLGYQLKYLDPSIRAPIFDEMTPLVWGEDS